MKCRDPILCYIKEKGSKVYRHFSMASDTFKRLHQIKKDPVFNCGQCLFCRKKRAYELASRCVLHASLYKENCFLTLTYDEKKTGYHNNFAYRDIQLFKKRLRKNVYPKKIEVFNVHEYGKNGKKHWHLIVFNHDFSGKTLHTNVKGIPLYTDQTLARLWSFGFVTIGDVSAASAMYQAQYCEKDFKNGHAGTVKKSDSKHSKIGYPYFLKHYEQILRLGYIPINGRKLPVPRSFEKIAHRHYGHFYDRSLFARTASRGPLFGYLRDGEANKSIADLWLAYKQKKQSKIQELEEEWNKTIELYLTTKEDPDFLKAANNTLYDLKNRTGQEQF